MANRVTLANGRVVEVTRDNWRSLAVEDNEAARAKGLDSGAQAARLLNFRMLGGQDNSYFSTAGARAAADRVLNNPLVRASDAVYSAAPAGVQEVWRDSSDGTIGTAKRAGAAVAAGAAVVKDRAAELLARLPAAADRADTTLRIVAVSAAVVAVAGVAFYVRPWFRR